MHVPNNHSDDCVFYLDESGDLGFGSGSSRHFVIAVVCVDGSAAKRVTRYVRRFRIRKGYPTEVELKASGMKHQDRLEFCQGIASQPCSVHYVVVNKSRIQPHLRQDNNILYNWLCGLILAPLMSTLRQASVLLDCRSIKVKSGNSLSDYLCIKLWYEMNSQVSVPEFSYPDSRESLGIQAADLVSNTIFRYYERSDSAGYAALQPIMGEYKELFLSGGTTKQRLPAGD